MILGFIAGLTLGALLMNLAVEEERKEKELLKKTIDDLEEDLDRANFKIHNRDNFISDYQEEHEILLNNASELRAKIVDLENNLELVTNSLSDENKKLIPDFDSQN